MIYIDGLGDEAIVELVRLFATFPLTLDATQVLYL